MLLLAFLHLSLYFLLEYLLIIIIVVLLRLVVLWGVELGGRVIIFKVVLAEMKVGVVDVHL